MVAAPNILDQEAGHAYQKLDSAPLRPYKRPQEFVFDVYENLELQRGNGFDGEADAGCRPSKNLIEVQRGFLKVGHNDLRVLWKHVRCYNNI